MTQGVAMLVVGILLVLIGSGKAINHRQQSGEHLRISAEQRRDILRIHNDLRRLEYAADMEYMEWSERLANLSLITANDCIFLSVPFVYGEMTSQNMAIISSRNTSEVMSAVTWWYDDTYNITTGQCKQSTTCYQHLQLISSSNNKVGCAYKNCDLLFNAETNETVNNMTLFVCTYLPGVSSVNISRPPFIVGEACSQCTSGAIWCDMAEPRGLCRRNCSEEMSECILIDKTTTDTISTSHQNNLTSLENLISNITATQDTNNANPNKTLSEPDTVKQITSTSRETVKSTFTSKVGLPSVLSTRTTRDLRYSTASSDSGSATGTRSTPADWSSSGQYTDGATDVAKARTEPVIGSFSEAMTPSFTDSLSSSVPLTSFSTTEFRSNNDGSSPGSQSDARRETWQTSASPWYKASRTTDAAVITSSVNVERLPKSTTTFHTTTYQPMSTSQDSSTRTPTDTSWAILNTTTWHTVNTDTTTVDGINPSYLSSDTVTTTRSARVTSHRAILPTTTTNNNFISDPGEIRDNTSPKSPFWIIVILIVSLDSLLLIAIIITGIVIIKQKTDTNRGKLLYEDDKESQMSESKYYHFGFEDFQNEATA